MARREVVAQAQDVVRTVRDIYGELAKWHKPTDKPQKTIGKRSNFPGGKTADKAWTTMLANDAAEEAPQLAPPAPVLVKKYIKRGARWWAVYV